jgi:hypothetical protein
MIFFIYDLLLEVSICPGIAETARSCMKKETKLSMPARIAKWYMYSRHVTRQWEARGYIQNAPGSISQKR